ncbi:hypothetical protein CTZ27_37710 [Streptomyces griseocarneus]|nr:hypothetical protein CTZ27_37710 [Streptomyces griseocarneus]
MTANSRQTALPGSAPAGITTGRSSRSARSRPSASSRRTWPITVCRAPTSCWCPYYEDVLLPVESILDGTWGSGTAPAEWADFLLMRRMHWSWDELQQTPAYVRRYALDFLGLIAQQEHRAQDQARREADRRMG